MKWKQFLSGTAILFYTLLAVVILAFVMKQSDSRIIAKLDAGSATIEAVHPGNGEDLAPGEVNQLILRRGSHVEDRVTPKGFRFCSLQPGQYEIDVYVDNVLAVSYPFGVEKGRNTPARVKVPDRGTVLVKVFGFDRKPVNGAFVQIVSFRVPDQQLRGENIVDHDTVATDGRAKAAGTTGLLYLQPTVAASDGYKITVLWKNQELASKDVPRFQPGMNPPVEFNIDQVRAANP